MSALREWLSARPWWVTALGLFCAYMTFVYLPYGFVPFDGLNTLSIVLLGLSMYTHDSLYAGKVMKCHGAD